MSKSTRTGFSLVEMLVVIAIIGILAGLILPAIGAARNRARMIECNNKLRQLAVANMERATSKDGLYPGYQQTIPKTIPSGAPGAKNAPWTVMLLPGIEQEALYTQWADPSVALAPGGPMTQDIPLLQCPSDFNFELKGFGATSYVANTGFRPSHTATYAVAKPLVDGTQTKGHGVFLDRVTPGISGGGLVRIKDIKDGTSSTIAFSENLHSGQWWVADSTTPNPDVARFNSGMMWFAVMEPGYIWPTPPGAPSPLPPTPTKRMKINGDPAERNTLPMGPISGPGFFAGTSLGDITLARPSSAHPSVVTVAFVGGNTIFMRESIDYHVYQQLLTPHGSSSGMPDKTYLLQADHYQD